MKIAFLVPLTSNGRDWKNIEESYFYQIFLRTLIGSTSSKYFYKIYLVIDHDDHLFFNANLKNLNTLGKSFNISIIKIINNCIEKGHLTKLWNLAFKKAYEDGCQYFYQCGDDVQFLTYNWIDDCINQLIANQQIGLTGPLDLGRLNANKICHPGQEQFLQTQSFVGRKHMEIFGYYFPEEIKNWFCDDWITKVYYPKYFYKLKHFILNKGGKQRYKISGSHNENDPVKKKCEELILDGKLKIKKYIG